MGDKSRKSVHVIKGAQGSPESNCHSSTNSSSGSNSNNSSDNTKVVEEYIPDTLQAFSFRNPDTPRRKQQACFPTTAPMTTDPETPELPPPKIRLENDARIPNLISGYIC